jgi:hypothetical protein
MVVNFPSSVKLAHTYISIKKKKKKTMCSCGHLLKMGRRKMFTHLREGNKMAP